MKIKINKSRYEAFMERKVKPLTIKLYATIGFICVSAFIGYTVNECLRELYSYATQTKTIIIDRATNPEARNGDSADPDSDERAEDLRVAEVSAYTSSKSETDDSPFLTASGLDLSNHFECVVASNDYAFGTKLAIEGIGICSVEDRMNSRYTGTGNIDLYMGTDKQRALTFGRRKLSYIVIE